MSYRQRKKVILRYLIFLSAVLLTIFVGSASVVFAWDHPSHMVTAAIAVPATAIVMMTAIRPFRIVRSLMGYPQLFKPVM